MCEQKVRRTLTHLALTLRGVKLRKMCVCVCVGGGCVDAFTCTCYDVLFGRL